MMEIKCKKIKVPVKLKKFVIAALPYWLGALIISVGGYNILEILYPLPPVEVNWLKISAVWLVFSAGLAWITHGFGFLLVRVSR